MNRWAVVIATHSGERRQQLNDAIRSVLAQGEEADVVVVVDHNQGLLDSVKSEWGHVLTVMPNLGPKGLSGARNTGTAVSSSTWVAFVDDDASADPGWLEELDKAAAHQGVVGVAGLATPRWEAGAAPNWFPEEYLWVVGSHYRGHRMDEGPVRSPIGANMAFPRDTVLNLGGFSPIYSTPPFNRCDDVDFALRTLNMEGGSIWFAPKAVVQHSVPAERSKYRYFLQRCRLEGRAKAALVASHGMSTFSLERRYVARTLLAGIARNLKPREWRAGGLAKAFSIGVGLVVTTLGYLEGKTLLRRFDVPPGDGQMTWMPEVEAT